MRGIHISLIFNGVTYMLVAIFNKLPLICLNEVFLNKYTLVSLFQKLFNTIYYRTMKGQLT